MPILMAPMRTSTVEVLHLTGSVKPYCSLLRIHWQMAYGCRGPGLSDRVGFCRSPGLVQSQRVRLFVPISPRCVSASSVGVIGIVCVTPPRLQCAVAFVEDFLNTVAVGIVGVMALPEQGGSRIVLVLLCQMLCVHYRRSVVSRVWPHWRCGWTPLPVVPGHYRCSAISTGGHHGSRSWSLQGATPVHHRDIATVWLEHDRQQFHLFLQTSGSVVEIPHGPAWAPPLICADSCLYASLGRVGIPPLPP